MSVSRIDDDSVDTCIYQCLHTVEGIYRHTHTGSHAQTTFLILACHRLILCLSDILVGDQSYQMVVLIHNRQFLDLILLQDLCGRIQIRLQMGSDKILLGHHLINLLVQATLETQVTVGDDSHQIVILVDNRDTTDVIFCHHVKCILHGPSTTDRHRVVYHTILSTLNDGHLAGLSLNGHVLVNHADTTLTSNGNSHSTLCNSIHCCCHKGNIQVDITGEPGFQLYLLRKYF